MQVRACKISWVAFLAAMLTCGAASAQQAEQAKVLFNQASELYQKDLSNETYLRIIPMIEQASRLDPGNDRIWGVLSEYYWEYADRLPKETSAQKQVKLDFFNKGVEAARKCLELNPKNCDGIFFYATNMASAAEMVSIVKSIWMFPMLKSSMDKVDTIDPDYSQGAVDRFWSEVASRVPDFVAKAVDQSKEDQIAGLKEDIAKWPGHFENYTYLARLQWDVRQKDQALKSMEYVLTHDPNADPENAAQNRIEVEVAKKTWKQWTGKDFTNK